MDKRSIINSIMYLNIFKLKFRQIDSPKYLADNTLINLSNIPDNDFIR